MGKDKALRGTVSDKGHTIRFGDGPEYSVRTHKDGSRWAVVPLDLLFDYDEMSRELEGLGTTMRQLEAHSQAHQDALAALGESVRELRIRTGTMPDPLVAPDLPELPPTMVQALKNVVAGDVIKSAPGISKEETERYSNGKCAQLAYALYMTMGWPMFAVGDDDKKLIGEGGISWVHVVVQTPAGDFLDITGLHTGEEVLEYWGEHMDHDEVETLIPIAPDQFAPMLGEDPPDNWTEPVFSVAAKVLAVYATWGKL